VAGPLHSVMEPTIKGTGDYHTRPTDYWSSASMHEQSRNASDPPMFQHPPGGQDHYGPNDEESHPQGSLTKSMHRNAMHIDIQQASPLHQSVVVVLDRPSSDGSGVHAHAASAANADSEAAPDHVIDKGKEKVEEKKKELVFIGGVELVDLDDCEVPDKRLECDSDDKNDNDISNAEGMDVSNGVVSCLQFVEHDLDTAPE
jgi:hypothetical protein